MSKILPFGLVGFTEIVMAVLLIVILILRPAGIMGGRELRWPPGPFGLRGKRETTAKGGDV
jgi:ABC-type branched-subunit amino acid transport system permease subunit